MPWTNQIVIANTVIIEGSDDGLFVYSGAPANGNLVASVTATSGVDPYGNPYKAGSSVYGALATFVQMVAGAPASVFFGTGDPAENAPGQALTQIASVAATRVLATTLRAPRVTGENINAFCSLVLESSFVDLSTPPQASIVVSDGTNINSLGVTPTGYNLTNQALTATGGHPAAPTLITTDTWQTLPTINGWTVPAGGRARVMLMPDNTVMLDLFISAGTLTDFTQVVSALSATYRPASQMDFVCATAGGTAALANPPTLIIFNTGQVEIANLPTGCTGIRVLARYPKN